MNQNDVSNWVVNDDKTIFTEYFLYILRELLGLTLQSFAYFTDKQKIYSQLSTYGHYAMTDTPIIRTAAKSQAKNKLQTFD